MVGTWCINEAPHAAHRERNEFGSFNECTGIAVERARITAVRDAARLLEDARFGGAGTLSRTWGVRRGVFLRLAADIASGDADASEADMRTVLALLRDARSTLTDPGLRTQFAQDRKTVMDTIIGLLAATEG